MENSKLTPEQIKSLKLFSYYIKSYGKTKVDTAYHYYDGSFDYKDDSWYGGSGHSVESYQEIDNVIQSIIDSNLLDDNMDFEGYGKLEVTIDSDNDTIEIVSVGYFMNSRTMGDTKEISEMDGGEELLKLVKSENVTQGTVDFSGGGDSGDINNNLSIHRGGYIPLPKQIENELYDWLESFYGGWEINEGSQGSFNFDFSDGTVELYFEENYEESETDTVFETNF